MIVLFMTGISGYMDGTTALEILDISYFTGLHEVEVAYMIDPLDHKE